MHTIVQFLAIMLIVSALAVLGMVCIGISEKISDRRRAKRRASRRISLHPTSGK